MSRDAENLEIVRQQLREEARMTVGFGVFCLGLALFFGLKGWGSVQGHDDAIIYGVLVGGLGLTGVLLVWKGVRRHPLMRALAEGRRGIEVVGISYRSLQGGTHEARVDVRLGSRSVEILAPAGRERELADWLAGSP